MINRNKEKLIKNILFSCLFLKLVKILSYFKCFSGFYFFHWTLCVQDSSVLLHFHWCILFHYVNTPQFIHSLVSVYICICIYLCIIYLSCVCVCVYIYVYRLKEREMSCLQSFPIINTAANIFLHICWHSCTKVSLVYTPNN